MQPERMVFRVLAVATAAVMVGCSTPVQPASMPSRAEALRVQALRAEARAVRPAPSPQPRHPYRIEEVRIPNGGIKLAGSLTLPHGQGPFPAAIIINGSGKVTRNSINPYLVIRDHLTRRGIAVLHMDTRGVGGSGGVNWRSTSADFATDVVAELKFLRTRPDIDPVRVGLLGHSEGGAIAPMIASRHDVAFVVLLAAPGVSGAENLTQQVIAMMGLYGLAPTGPEAEAMKAAGLALRSEREPLERAKYAVKLLGPALRKNARGQTVFDAPTFKAKVLEIAFSPWLQFSLRHDPRPYLAGVKAPVLVMNGTKDILVSAEQSVPAIRQALDQGGNRQVTIAIIPGLNHFFHRVRDDSAGEALGYKAMAPDALSLLGDWVAARTQGGRSPVFGVQH